MLSRSRASSTRPLRSTIGSAFGLAALLATSTALLAPQHAAAQPAGNIDLNAFRPAMDSKGYLTLNASQMLGDGDIAFGIGALDWGRKMLTFEGSGNSYAIDNMVAATLIAAYGMKFGSVELEFGASVPFVIMSGDRGPDDLGGPGPNDDQAFKLEGQGIGQIGLHLKTRFMKTTKGPRIGLGMILSAYLPTVSQEDRFLADNKFVPQAMLILDKELGKDGRFRVALNAGIRIRSESSFTDSGNNGSPPTGKTITAGTEIPVGVGLAYGLVPQKFDLVGEITGAVPIGAENYFPLEAIGGVKLYLGNNSFLSLGGGIGLLPSKGANPDQRAFIGIVFEPNIGDRDGDGYKDDVDKCPSEPEDFDKFEDAEGCPDPDNDRDGILDEDDACPLVPEDRDGIDDEDGCPEGNAGDRDGDGLMDDVDKCPDEPEDFDQFEDEDGCPEPDNDQDGILDVDDLCPNDPEDKDEFEDADGCPEADNDKDRIVDTLDKCPGKDGEALADTQETYNGKDDDDGCPDKGRVILTETGIEILDMVYFELDKAVIMSKSFPILDAVAATVIGNPAIQLIEIQGHTDDQGNDAYNLGLSDRRAASVKKYLTDKGVEENRLTSQGYGETQPLIKQTTKAARAKNRRVAFLILKRGTE